MQMKNEAIVHPYGLHKTVTALVKGHEKIQGVLLQDSTLCDPLPLFAPLR